MSYDVFVNALKVIVLIWVGVLVMCSVYSAITVSLMAIGSSEGIIDLSVLVHLLGHSLTSVSILSFGYLVFGAVWLLLMLLVLQYRLEVSIVIPMSAILSGMVWVIVFIGMGFVETRFGKLWETTLAGFVAALVSGLVFSLSCYTRQRTS